VEKSPKEMLRIAANPAFVSPQAVVYYPIFLTHEFLES
jgi:hypothetical protein